MEYRRRRRRRARRAASSVSGAGKVFVALLVVAGVVYVVSASAAGTWIAQNVMAPVFRTVDDFVSGVKATPTPGGAAQAEETPGMLSPAGNDAPTASEQIELPAMTCFALQMGVYSSAENANAQAASLQKQGAGGYVLEDGGRYRVLAAGYEQEESLRAVKEQLTAQGMDCALYQLEAPKSVLEVTASQEQVTDIQSGLRALMKLQSELASAALKFDQEGMTPTAGRELAGELLSTFRQAGARLLSMQGQGILTDMQACLAHCEDALEELAEYNTESTVDFSSKMKYTHLYIASEYGKLGQQISAY